MVQRFSLYWRLVSESLRWEGPFHVVVRVGSRILKPFLSLRIVHFYETDVTRPVPDGSPEKLAQVTTYSGEENLQKIKNEFQAVGLLVPGDIESRLHQGEFVGIAKVEGATAGYCWMSFTQKWVDELELTLRLRSDEALLYDSFVLPRWRGRRLNFHMNVALKDVAGEHGIARTLGYMSALNRRSLKLSKQMGSRKIMTVAALCFRRMGCVWRVAFGASLRSRFLKIGKGELIR